MSGSPAADGPAVSPREIRRIILEQSRRADVGHIGSALCVADIVGSLYSGVLSDLAPDDPDRDRVVVSKGHSVLAVYAALHLRGWIDEATLGTFCAEGTLLGIHPDAAVAGIDFSTGSLGQGLSFAAGAALAARLQGSNRRAFALVSDAECNEGSLWEAVMFAAHHRLANLTTIVDLNGQQALGDTDQVLSLDPLADRWRAFGWDVHEVDGHDVDTLRHTLGSLDLLAGPPHVVVAGTTFGKGVSFMEGQLKWHYWPMSEAEFRQALDEVAAA